MTPDPIGLAGGVNLYTYVQNDPVNFVDPEGLFLLPGALIGAGMELGVQLATNDWDIGAVDWVDVVGMGIVGGVAPGALGAGKSALNSIKAIKTLKSQLGGAKAVNRQLKLQSKINKHKMSIKDLMKLQGSIAAGKSLFKKYVNDPCEDN